jgi:CDGSH iron-sulfur domain-containing protein 3
MPWKLFISRLPESGKAEFALPIDSATHEELIERKHQVRHPIAEPQTIEEVTMPRLIRHDLNHPYEIPEGTELPLYICGCGLSKNKPFCDGSHKKTRDEEAADTYIYDDTGRARVVKQY